MSTSARPDLPIAPPEVARALRATYVAFVGSGVAFASWASRIPQVRDRLELSASELGLVLLAIAVGSLIALPLSGPVVARVGSAATVVAMSLLFSVGLWVVALGVLAGVWPVVAGLFLVGLGTGAWDVAMNVQGAMVEQRRGRSTMPRLHAGFSVGTVAGALTGAGVVALDVPVPVHLAVVATLVAVVVPLSTRGFLVDRGAVDETDPSHAALHDADPDHHPRRGAFAAWKEPRTLLVGVVALAFAFAEGTGNDWIAVAAIDGYGRSAVVGTLLFAGFLTAMTLGRWFGPDVIDRFGRVPVVRAVAVLAVVGSLLFVVAPTTWVAVVAVLLWGLGTSLGFPVSMSAASDDPEHAAGRVSVVASIGYCAFLAGPPLIGVLGDSVGVLRAITTVSVLLGVAALLATALRPEVDPTPGPRTKVR
ncbi:MFS transporter [Aquipuribacter nitratireducens]|uniref:MFS transporter n=1 Tax=Aquipuribacter nitratireducens TaxID=650104 RepID=A0ABW0GHM2_9MICO